MNMFEKRSEKYHIAAQGCYKCGDFSYGSGDRSLGVAICRTCRIAWCTIHGGHAKGAFDGSSVISAIVSFHRSVIIENAPFCPICGNKGEYPNISDLPWFIDKYFFISLRSNHSY